MGQKKQEMFRDQLKLAIEQTRSELSAQLRRADYNFNDAGVLQTSRKLDRLLNLYYHLKGIGFFD